MFTFKSFLLKHLLDNTVLKVYLLPTEQCLFVGAPVCLLMFLSCCYFPGQLSSKLKICYKQLTKEVVYVWIESSRRNLIALLQAYFPIELSLIVVSESVRINCSIVQ